MDDLLLLQMCKLCLEYQLFYEEEANGFRALVGKIIMELNYFESVVM